MRWSSIPRPIEGACAGETLCVGFGQRRLVRANLLELDASLLGELAPDPLEANIGAFDAPLCQGSCRMTLVA